MNDQRDEALRNVFSRLSYWSVQIAKDGEDANLAPPTELVDAINRLARASAAPQEPVKCQCKIVAIDTDTGTVRREVSADCALHNGSPLYAAPQPQAAPQDRPYWICCGSDKFAKHSEPCPRHQGVKAVWGLHRVSPQPQAAPQAPSQEPLFWYREQEIQGPMGPYAFRWDSPRQLVDETQWKPLYAAPQPQAAPQEPVAWMHEDSNGQNMLITESLRKDMPKASVAGYTIPLYAAPQPQAPSSDDVRDKRIAELEAKIHTLTNRADMRRKHLRRLEAALADARNSALEEAAKVCEQRSPRTWEEIPDDLPTRQDISDEESHACAAAIRALRTTSEK